MRRITLICLTLLMSASLYAQGLSFGFYSRRQVLQSLPAYAQVGVQLAQLKKQYADELANAQQEFSQKYETFIENQASYAPSIRAKRQAELEQLLQQNETFRNEAARLLKQAEDDAYKPLNERVSAAVREVGEELQLSFVFDTDEKALTYVNAEQGQDLTQILIARLK